MSFSLSLSLFFFNDTATTEIYTLSLHDALPILIVGPNALQVGIAPRGLCDARSRGPACTSRRGRRRLTLLRRKDRKSTRLNSSHGSISYAVFCLKKKKKKK